MKFVNEKNILLSELTFFWNINNRNTIVLNTTQYLFNKNPENRATYKEE